jgi:serine protease inhibitor
MRERTMNGYRIRRLTVRRAIAMCAAAGLLSGTALAKGAAAPAAGAQAPALGQAEKQAKKEEPRSNAVILKAQSKLAMNLLRQLGKQKGKSVVVSPSSLAGALSVIELGANDDLRASIPKVLGFKTSPMAWAEVGVLRNSTSRAVEGGPLSVANGIVIDQDAKPSQTVIETRRQTGVAVEVRDFSKKETVQALNAWVSAQTKGLIPAIIDRIPEGGGLIALNALHFKDQWKRKFDPAKTRTAPFHMVGGKTIDAHLMDSGENGEFSFRQEGKFVAVDLPYATDGFSIALVTTKSKPAALEEFSGVSDWLTGEGYAMNKGDVSLPRLELRGSHDLRRTLAELKLKGGAVTGFTEEPLRLVNAQQRVVLKVDEAGAEAAAATSVTAARSMGTGKDYVRFVGDKPFIFALREAKSGLILIAGYVAQPS